MFTFSPSLSRILSADLEVFHGNDFFLFFAIYSQEICFQYYVIHLWCYFVTKNFNATPFSTHTSRCAWHHPKKNHFLAVFWETHFNRKEKKKAATWCLLFYKDIEFPAGGLRQIWSIWKDHEWIQQKKKWGLWLPPRRNVWIKDDHLSSLVQKHHWPFCPEPQYCRVEDCKTKRDKSGWDCREQQGVKENKRIHCVRVRVFSKSKWTTEGKKERTSRHASKRELGNASATMSSRT